MANINTTKPSTSYYINAVCVTAEDMGVITTKFGTRPMVKLTFETEELNEYGQKRRYTRLFHKHTHEKSTLSIVAKSWCNRDMGKVQETTPEMKLLELIDSELWHGDPDDWEGTAAKMEKKLVRDESDVQYEARRLLNWPNATGSYLARLRDTTAQYVRGRITSRKVNGNTIWTVRPPARIAAEPVVTAPAAATTCEIPPMPAGLR